MKLKEILTLGERQIAQSKKVSLIKEHLQLAKDLIDVEALEYTLEVCKGKAIPIEYINMIRLCINIGNTDFENDLPKILR